MHVHLDLCGNSFKLQPNTHALPLLDKQMMTKCIYQFQQVQCVQTVILDTDQVEFGSSPTLYNKGMLHTEKLLQTNLDGQKDLSS